MRATSTAQRGLPLAAFLFALSIVQPSSVPAQVIPDDGSTETAPNTSGNQVSFWVTNNSSVNDWIQFDCTPSGAVIACPDPAGQNVAAWGTVEVIVTFTTGAAGVGHINLFAFGQEGFTSDNGAYDVLVVPPPGPPGNTTYTLAYDGAGKLDRITDPAGRVLEATVSGLTLAVLKDPTGDSVIYGYDSEQRLTTRTNRRGHLTTYRFVNGLRVTGVEIPLSSPSDLGITSLAYWDERGLVIGQPGGGPYTAVETWTLFTHLDGPRTDLPDAARFWVDRWGAPTRIERNALGTGPNTYLTRGDALVPALVTQVQAPNGFITQATYDARGNVKTVTEVSPYGGANAVTRYEWDLTWDLVARIIPPQLDSVVFAYSATNGNRLWQEDARGAPSRVTFNYANSHSLLSSVVLPGGARDSIRYSGQLGNPFFFRTAQALLSLRYQDGVGRDTLVLTPIDGGQLYQRQRNVYDAMNRVLHQHTVGPALGAFGAESVLVAYRYDREGNLDSLARQSVPNQAGVGVLTTRWLYDLAGRRIKEVATDGNRDSTAYDPAGNVIAVFTRRGHALTMGYDTLNRLNTRVVPAMTYSAHTGGIPSHAFADPENRLYPAYPNDGSNYSIFADTARYTYDVLGNVLTADNRDAKISRSYYPSGRLQSETQRIRTVDGTDFSTHTYQMQFTYDLNGRRWTIQHPLNLAPSGSEHTVQYFYSQQTGLADSLRDIRGHKFKIHYNLRGEVDTLRLPGGITELFAYDLDGRLSEHRTRNQSTAPYRYLDSLLRLSTFQYDARGKVLAERNNQGLRDTLLAGYSGLGLLRTSKLWSHSMPGASPALRWRSDETFSIDGVANLKTSLTTTVLEVNGSLNSSTTWNQTYSYQSGTGRLTSTSRAGPPTLLYQYDAAGNTEFVTNQEPVSSTRSEQRYYYGTDGKLRAVDSRQFQEDVGFTRMAFDEYRYDAFGRRILVRSRRTCKEEPQNQVDPACAESMVRRTVWDGDHELYEIQMPDRPEWRENDTAAVQLGERWVDCQGPSCSVFVDVNPFFGRVAYLSGIGVDQPFAVTRLKYAEDQWNVAPHVWPTLTIVPHWNARRQADNGTFGDGGARFCEQPSQWCMKVAWPPGWLPYHRQEYIAGAWHGTVLEDKAEKSGTAFRRNRYYDPQTGRFTQEDPIGLAGGLNLYGFADGDPINFSDPFGLKVCFSGTRQQVRRLRAGAESATNMSISLDDENCVTEANPRAGSKGYEEAQAGFTDLVQSPGTFTIRFTGIYTSEQISRYHIDIFQYYNALAYPALDARGRCRRDQVPWNLTQLMAHELFHHYTVPRTGRMNPDETAAVRAENIVNRIRGWRERCAY